MSLLKRSAACHDIRIARTWELLMNSSISKFPFAAADTKDQL